jgi:uncharacterized membrane protein YtjA (UPF0391 family)
LVIALIVAGLRYSGIATQAMGTGAYLFNIVTTLALASLRFTFLDTRCVSSPSPFSLQWMTP